MEKADARKIIQERSVMKNWPADKINSTRTTSNVAVKRWCEFTGKDATLEANGKSFSVLEKRLEADAA